MNEKTEQQLAEFLEEHRSAARRGVTLEAIAKAQENLSDNLMKHGEEDRQHFEQIREEIATKVASHDHRLTTVEATLQKGVEPRLARVEESTGSHDIPEILNAAGRLAKTKSTKPPGIGRMFDSEISKTVVKVCVLVIAASLGWVVRHLTWSEPAHAAPPATSSSARP